MRTNRRYLLALLSVIVAFNYTDRFALGIALEDIKHDLHLSDSQLGFLSGIAFALFYSLMGMPIARWADRGNRVSIVSMTAALWSVAVALCATAGSFTQILLMRVVVGVGEAGCVPPSLSLIADFYARGERPRAVSVYMQGIAASMVLGYLAAGWLNQYWGWRAMFVVIGLPGLGLAALAKFTLRDPRAEAGVPIKRSPHPESLRKVSAAIWRRPTFRHLLYSCAVNWFFSVGTLQWTPTFFVRSFGFKTGALGTWFAVIVGLGSMLGTWCGGEWAARRASRNEARQLKAMTVVTCVSGVLTACVYLPAVAPNAYVAFAWLGLASVLANTVNGPQFAIIQTLFPDRMRATAVALVYLFANLIGIGLGPWAVGTLSDAFRPMFGEESLRYAMLALCPGFIWSAWHLWKAAQTASRDIEAAQSGEVPMAGMAASEGACLTSDSAR